MSDRKGGVAACRDGKEREGGTDFRGESRAQRLCLDDCTETIRHLDGDVDLLVGCKILTREEKSGLDGLGSHRDRRKSEEEVERPGLGLGA